MSAVRYERLLPQIATIVEHLLQPEATVVPRAKQKLVQATNEFNQDMMRARERATTMPGGELVVEEQDEIIDMLEQLKKRKRNILSKFANEASPPIATNLENIKMEVDSTASTPS